MVRSKQAKKKLSRVVYEESHPTISFRVDKETHDRLKQHLRATGFSFASFVKNALGKEEAMVEERVAKLASRKIEEGKTLSCDLELYDLVLDLAQWAILLWANLPDPMEVPCLSCLFPSKLSKRQSRRVILQMLESGDFKCPDCALTLRNRPQLAWVLLATKVTEEVRREKFLESLKKEKPMTEGK